jgi:hypothetical protein
MEEYDFNDKFSPIEEKSTFQQTNKKDNQMMRTHSRKEVEESRCYCRGKCCYYEWTQSSRKILC